MCVSCKQSFPVDVNISDTGSSYITNCYISLWLINASIYISEIEGETWDHVDLPQCVSTVLLILWLKHFHLIIYLPQGCRMVKMM